jgi:alanyl-tRNA synthetase
MDETLVTFATGAAVGRGRVLAVAAGGDGEGPSVVVDEIGSVIPVRRGEEGWVWLVAHRLGESAEPPQVGDEVELVVDVRRRRALSAAHTACHLAALAMNRAASHLWRKEARRDSLGSPDLDQIAMVSSVMDESGLTDVYRLGKSLRKKGFETATGASPDVDAGPARCRRGWQSCPAAEPTCTASMSCSGSRSSTG